MAVLCFHLVKARSAAVRIFGWLIGIYFIIRYAQGCIISARLVSGGSWIETITAGINVLLALTTLACLLKARWIRKGYITDNA